jgi:hypothetical protein
VLLHDVWSTASRVEPAGRRLAVHAHVLAGDVPALGAQFVGRDAETTVTVHRQLMLDSKTVPLLLA